MDAKATLLTIASNFEGFHLGMLLIFGMLGFLCVGSSLYMLVTWNRRARSGENPVTMFYLATGGAILISLPEILKRQTSTMLQSADPRSILDYATPSGSEAAMLAQVLLGLITFFGWCSTGYGWLLYTRLSRGQARHDAGDVAVFLIAGTLLSNLLVVSDIVAATFNTENYLRQIVNS